MTKNKNERKKLNAFDVAVIILVVALIATVGYRMYSTISEDTSQESAKYIMEFECEEEYESLLKYIDEGDAVYFSVNGDLVGYMYVGEDDENGAIYAVFKTEPDTDAEELSNSAEPYNKVMLRGQIKLNPETVRFKSGNYYTVGDINITEGGYINVYTNKTEFRLRVVNITAIDE